MHSKKTILIFIDWFLPGYKAGGPVSSNANIIAHLQGDFRFKVVTRNTDYTETVPYPHITPNCWIQQEGFEGYYFSPEQLNFRNLKKLVNETHADVYYINGIYSRYFSIFPVHVSRKKHKKVIVAARGMLSDHAIGVKRLKKQVFLLMARLTGLYRQVTFHATNAEEATAIQKATGKKSQVFIAPNLPKKGSLTWEQKPKETHTLKLAYIARISPEKNNLFALQTLEALSAKLHAQKEEKVKTTVIFDLYGPVYNEAYWSQCQEIIQRLPSNIIVNYKGAIDNRQVSSTLKQYHFLLMPTRGENFGHTILEAFQSGCPVIISDKTPWRNLGEIESSKEKGESMRVGWDIPLEQPEKFVEVIEQCARMGQEEYDTLSRNAFAYARQVTEDPAVPDANRKLFE